MVPKQYWVSIGMLFLMVPGSDIMRGVYARKIQGKLFSEES